MKAIVRHGDHGRSKERNVEFTIVLNSNSVIFRFKEAAQNGRTDIVALMPHCIIPKLVSCFETFKVQEKQRHNEEMHKLEKRLKELKNEKEKN